jgi:hypothetical protein
MSMTPEGRIKKAVDLVLEEREKAFLSAPIIWWYKPVQQGFGKRALDYVGCIRGRFFAIETKAPGEELTRLQKLTAFSMCMAGGAVWIISEIETVKIFQRWLERQ